MQTTTMDDPTLQLMQADLPAAVLAHLQAAPAANELDDGERRRQFELAVAARRDDAVRARRESGIEETWRACEEAYLGIDDENRADVLGPGWIKPPTMDGPLIRQGYANSSDGVRSTAYVLLTTRYVDAGAAKIGEITLPVDDRPFSLKPTPVPDLIAGKEDERPVADGGQVVMRPPSEIEALQGAQGPQPLRVKDLAADRLRQIEEAASKAESRIYDWLVEGGHASQMRRVIFDASRLGTGCLAGPVPQVSRTRSVTRQPDGSVAVDYIERTVPATRWVDVWNLFPDYPACGENIHDGSFVLERDFFSRAQLKALQQAPEEMGYDVAAIARVLKEGPDKCDLDETGFSSAKHSAESRNRPFTVWYYYGEITYDELALCNGHAAAAVVTDDGAGGRVAPDSVFAIVTLVNDTAIRVVVNPLDSGSFPYHVVNWRRRLGHWAGVGVAEQVRVPQRVVNATTRALLNNAGQAAGSQIVVDRGMVTPADGSWKLTPNKFWWKNADAAGRSMREAFELFQVPNQTPQLMQIVEYGFKLAEESSNIPLITQGQSGKTTPETFGGQVLQNNNANQLLRDVGFAFADQITDPLVRQCYEWLLLDPDVPADEKGDYKVDTSAAMAMIERAIQDQTIVQMGAMVGNPAFGIDPERWFAQMCRIKRLDPRDFQFTEDEKAKRDATPPPPPVPVAVAQIRAQTDQAVAQQRAQIEAMRVKRDIDRDNVFQEGQRDEMALRRELAMLDYSLRHNITLEQVKADLAGTAMKLNVQKELSQAALNAGANRGGPASPRAATPPTEPAGLAPAGQAYQR